MDASKTFCCNEYSDRADADGKSMSATTRIRMDGSAGEEDAVEEDAVELSCEDVGGMRGS